MPSASSHSGLGGGREGGPDSSSVNFDSIRVIFPHSAVIPGDRAVRRDRRVSDLAPGSVTLSFESLNLRERKLTSLEGLDEIHDLKTLYAQDNYLSSLQHIRQANLQTLHVERNRISDFIGCQRLPKLRAIHLEGNAVERIELFPLMCCLSLNPEMHKVNGRVLSKSERELIALLDRPVLRVAIYQGWFLSTKRNEGAIVDLPVDEFFFRLEPAFELLKTSRDSSFLAEFDIHLNLKRSYENLAGMPMLISPQMSRNSSGTQELQKERKLDRSGPCTKNLSSSKPKWSIAGVQSRRCDISDPPRESFGFFVDDLKGRNSSLDPAAEKFMMRVLDKRNRNEREEEMMDENERLNAHRARIRTEGKRVRDGKQKSDMKPISGPDCKATNTQKVTSAKGLSSRNESPELSSNEDNVHYSDFNGNTSSTRQNGHDIDRSPTMEPVRFDENVETGEEVLNWKLSSIDFESPVKVQNHIEHNSATKIDGFETATSCVSPMAVFGENLASVRRSLPHLPGHFETNSTQPESATSVEFSVPVTQYLHVSQIPLNGTATLSDFKVNFDNVRSDGRNFRENMLLQSCRIYVDDWRWVSSMRRILRKSLVDSVEDVEPNEINKQSLPFYPGIGLLSKLNLCFREWAIHQLWIGCKKSIAKNFDDQLLRGFILEWKLFVLYGQHCDQLSSSILRRQKVVQAVYKSRLMMAPAIDVDKLSSQVKKLRLSFWVLPQVTKQMKSSRDCLSRAICTWKDAIRDCKLEQLYSRIKQIETWILMARKQDYDAKEHQTRPLRTWDKNCLESLVDEMLHSLDRTEETELKDRLVLLLQVVTNVNGGDESDLEGSSR